MVLFAVKSPHYAHIGFGKLTESFYLVIVLESSTCVIIVLGDTNHRNPRYSVFTYLHISFV